jgi:hypothetical protein
MIEKCKRIRYASGKSLLTAVLIFLLSLFMQYGWYGPKSAEAGTHNLGTITYTNADITAAGDEIRVTIASSASAGGNDATDAAVSLSGTGLAASEIASVAAFYGGVEAGRTNNPASLTGLSITLAGTQKGGSNWDFVVSFNSGAGASNFVFTVDSITGTDNAGLPAGTAGCTVSLSSGGQTLDTFTDNSADAAAPATDLTMATVASSGGGAALTSTRVSVGGTVAASDVASIRVLWNAAEAGIVNSPGSLTNIDISLTGAGSGPGNLVYLLSLNGSAAGKTFNLTVTSVTGQTADNIPLPKTTATRNATAPAAQVPAGNIVLYIALSAGIAIYTATQGLRKRRRSAF